MYYWRLSIQKSLIKVNWKQNRNGSDVEVRGTPLKVPHQTKEIVMIEVLEILLPVGIIVACAYSIGYLSGSEATREIYNPTLRKNDLK